MAGSRLQTDLDADNAHRERRLAAARAGQLVWMDAKEAAAFLNYPKATFDTLAGRNDVPRHKRGAGWRYNREELTEWLMMG